MLGRISISTLIGGLFYSFWLAAFLLLSPGEGLLETIFWISAPLFTAMGFALGLTIASHFGAGDVTPFMRALPWPLVGCIIGAVTVYWFGPMLIVFSMLALGTMSIALREVLLLRK